MTIAQTLLVIMRYRPGLTRAQLATAIFGEAEVGRINKDCAYLVSIGLAREDRSTGAIRHFAL